MLFQRLLVIVLNIDKHNYIASHGEGVVLFLGTRLGRGVVGGGGGGGGGGVVVLHTLHVRMHDTSSYYKSFRNSCRVAHLLNLIMPSVVFDVASTIFKFITQTYPCSQALPSFPSLAGPGNEANTDLTCNKI